MTTSWISFLYYLSVWKIFSKNSFFLHSKGVSLSIADAKVDTFYKLTKHYWNFFVRIFKRKSQNTDFQIQHKIARSPHRPTFVIHTLQKHTQTHKIVLKGPHRQKNRNYKKKGNAKALPIPIIYMRYIYRLTFHMLDAPVEPTRTSILAPSFFSMISHALSWMNWSAFKPNSFF